MIAFFVRRVLGFVVTLFLAAVAIFAVLNVLPGDPAQFTLGLNASPEAVARLRAQMGLDRPAPERFFVWLFGMLRGDFGQSYTQRAPVAQLIWDRVGVTVPLAVMAMVISALVGRGAWVRGSGPAGTLSAADCTCCVVLAQPAAAAAAARTPIRRTFFISSLVEWRAGYPGGRDSDQRSGTNTESAIGTSSRGST